MWGFIMILLFNVLIENGKIGKHKLLNSKITLKIRLSIIICKPLQNDS